LPVANLRREEHRKGGRKEMGNERNKVEIRTEGKKERRTAEGFDEGRRKETSNETGR
jgi:hypothetical protein